MFNDWFTIGGVTIHGYGVMIGLGILAAFYVSERQAKKYGMSPDEASNLILANQLQVQIANRENELISERERKVEELLREKEVEMTKTRELMLSRINEISSDMQGVVGTIRSAYEKQDREKSDRITALEAENRALNDKVAQLQETNRELLRQLSEAQEHPYKNLKASWDKKKEAKKNGTPAKDNA